MTPPPAELFATRAFLGPALRAQPDRRLVDLVRDGYDTAFEEIVRRYRKPLDRFAAGIVGGRSEDVTQDAFSKALPALRRAGAEIELRPWLYRIVRNTALNDLRDRAPAAAELTERLPGARSAAAEVEAREDLRDLMERLRALPEPQRAALVMRELEGLSHEEIAAALGVSGGAARQAIFRARAALREGLGLFVPLPVLRALADHGGEAGAAGAGVALGGGALKAGMATDLIAGAVGAGVAIDHHHGERAGPESADAAPLIAGEKRADASEASPPSGSSNSGGGRSGESPGDSGGHRSGDESGRSLSDGGRSGADQVSGGGSGSSGPGNDTHSGEGSGRPGDDSSHSGSGSSGGSDDGNSGDRHGGDDGGSGGSFASSGDGGGSGGSGSDDGPGGGGGGEIEPEPTTAEATSTESTNDGGDSGGGESSGGESSGGGSGSSGPGSGADTFSGTTTSGSDGGP